MLSLRSSPPTDRVLKWNAYIQMAMLAGYQALENIAYLSNKGILFRRLSKQRRIWCDVISCRFWTAWVVGEFVRIAREVQLRARRKAEVGKADEVEEKEQMKAWGSDLVVNAAYLPLCLHWSFESGIGIPEWGVGLLGAIAGAIGVKGAWKRTG